MRYFIAVAEELNFTRAAQRLNTAQPSLSQQIQDLEREVGAPLLVRNKRSVALTPVGRVFLDEARLTLAQSRRAVANTRRAAEAGTLTVGFVPAAEIKIFPHILTALRARFPYIKLELQSLTTAEQHDALVRGEIDLAFMRSPLRDSGLAAKRVLRERLVVVLPADNPLAARAELSVMDLAAMPFLEIDPPHGGNLCATIRDYLQAQGMTKPPVQRVENVLTLLTLVGLGVGFSLLPDYAESLVFRNVATCRLPDPQTYVDLLMAWRDGDGSPENALFRELVSAHLGFT